MAGVTHRLSEGNGMRKLLAGLNTIDATPGVEDTTAQTWVNFDGDYFVETRA